MTWVWKRSLGLARALALVGFTGLLILALMTSLDVLLRWLFKAPLQGVNDVSSVVMAVVIAACIPSNLAMKQNIRVEVFGAIGGRMVHKILEVLSSSLTLVFILCKRPVMPRFQAFSGCQFQGMSSSMRL
ncbi:TRAP transporter small permease subunit, partial [Sulfitobacter pseudonitzschiae]